MFRIPPTAASIHNKTKLVNRTDFSIVPNLDELALDVSHRPIDVPIHYQKPLIHRYTCIAPLFSHQSVSRIGIP